jgi:hypothetical protein
MNPSLQAQGAPICAVCRRKVFFFSKQRDRVRMVTGMGSRSSMHSTTVAYQLPEAQMSVTKHTFDESHFATYEWYAKEWASHFGLQLRWQIAVAWSDDHDVGKYASVSYSADARNAVVLLSRQYECIEAPSERLIAESSCHEIIHLLLAALADLADDGAPRGFNPIGLEHEIVQTLVQISMRDHFDSMRARCPRKV